MSERSPKRKRTTNVGHGAPSSSPPKSPVERVKTAGKLKHPTVLFPAKPMAGKSKLDADLERLLTRKTAETDPVVPFDQKAPSTANPEFVPPTNPPAAVVEQALQTLARRAVRLAWEGTNPDAANRRQPTPFQVETAVEVLAVFLRQAARTVTAAGKPA